MTTANDHGRYPNFIRRCRCPGRWRYWVKPDFPVRQYFDTYRKCLILLNKKSGIPIA
jgi:hypothetical protein